MCVPGFRGPIGEGRRNPSARHIHPRYSICLDVRPPGMEFRAVVLVRRSPKIWPELRASAQYGRAMRWLICILVFGSLSACLQLGQALDSAGGTSTAGSAGSATDSDASALATGTNCGVDPSSGISLCLGISTCPDEPVDPDQLPSCGYRISGATIDLECLCGDSLCPLGSAASCLDAKALLADQSMLGVCARVADGVCTPVTQTATTTPSTSTCDKDCRTQCAGEPDCITLCGC
jgi:hypothetical protein